MPDQVGPDCGAATYNATTMERMLAVGEVASSEDGLVVSYLTLRKAVGILGIALPVLLAVGCLVVGQCDGLEPSISDYYGTPMRDLFVGLLFAIGLFLFSYRGYDRRDEVAGKLGCCLAMGVALFPTTSTTAWVHDAHLVFAAALFLTLAWFSLFQFTQTAKDVPPTLKKLQRNRIYRTCGIVMLACVASIALYKGFLANTALAGLNPVFWLESLALWAFGFSWLTKGEFILQD
jgi:hypothetical protein